METFTPFERYLALESAMLAATKRRDRLLVDELLDSMDAIWYCLSDEEQESLDREDRVNVARD